MSFGPYDAVVVFGGGLRKEGDTYVPATYEDSDNFGMLGYLIIGIFVFAWLISYVVYRVNRYDDIEVTVA